MRTTLRLTWLLLFIGFLCDPILSDDGTSSVGVTVAKLTVPTTVIPPAATTAKTHGTGSDKTGAAPTTVPNPHTVPTVASTKHPTTVLIVGTAGPSPTRPQTTIASKTVPAVPLTAPTGAPTGAPTAAPTAAPTGAPTGAPTAAPTGAPTGAPTAPPTAPPTVRSTVRFTVRPTDAPTTAAAPTAAPSAVIINTLPVATSSVPKALTASIGSTGAHVLPSLETVTHHQTDAATTSKTLKLSTVISSDTSNVAITMTPKVPTIVPVTGQTVGNPSHMVSTPSQAVKTGVTKDKPTTRPEPTTVRPTGPGTTALPAQQKPIIPTDNYTATTTQKTTTYNPTTPITSSTSTKSTTTRLDLLKKFTYTLLSKQETKEEKDLAEVCKRLMPDWQNGTCTLIWRHHNEKVDFDLVEINGNVKTSLANQLYEEITKKPTDNRTLIAILASCGALLIMIVILAVCASHHRKPYNENQQHLTEELNTVENGYHDNPTLEVMEVQPEMQEKKMALNGEFNDSWIVPIDNLLKDELQDEEDTHL